MSRPKASAFYFWREGNGRFKLGVQMEIIVGRIYKHFKGDYYLVEDVVIHSETKERMVLYRALYGNGLRYVRPYDMFKEKVDKVKYPNVKQEYRFELQDIESIAGFKEPKYN